MSQPRFIHLRTHSAYSLLEGAIPVKKLPGLAAAAGMPAVAVTDSGNLFAALEFSETAAKAGVQPIIGCQLPVAYSPAARPGAAPPPPRAMVLLAQNEAGYLNLMRLSSSCYLDSSDALPHVPLDTLLSHADGLICLTGGADGPLGQLIHDNQTGIARDLATRLRD